MREKWARRIAMLTGGLVVVLAVAFAYFQNPRHRPSPAPAPPTHVAAPPLVKSGRDVYAQKGCAQCHAIAGRGNPRSPLDGVASRLSEEGIRCWISPSVRPDKSFQAQHANIELTAAQREALTAYLRSLIKAKPESE
ncbi:MAG: c-type cytochrome [Gammaproteobacteria bacterium]|nr:c-type cytochrome [Gammaproteobacteria bacterium]MDH3562639.1 c-type cytochrome [Gammaproteobacteria bacterium]